MTEIDRTSEKKRRRAPPTEDRIRARNEGQIIKAAIDVFSKKGFDGARISEIAQLSGLPKANVYYYFESKEVIYRAVVTHLLKGWDDALDYIQLERAPGDALRDYVKAKLDNTRRNANESRLFAAEIIRGAQFLTRADRRHIKEVTDRAVTVLEQWIANGQIRPIDPRHLLIMLWSATQFYGDFEPLARNALGVKRLTGEIYDAAAETILQTVLYGLGPDDVVMPKG